MNSQVCSEDLKSSRTLCDSNVIPSSLRGLRLQATLRENRTIKGLLPIGVVLSPVTQEMRKLITLLENERSEKLGSKTGIRTSYL
jgi:hypothetical protein